MTELDFGPYASIGEVETSAGQQYAMMLELAYNRIIRCKATIHRDAVYDDLLQVLIESPECFRFLGLLENPWRMLSDPVEVLFGTQLGGGTDINRAIAYCRQLITRPNETIFVLITDLCEGGNRDEMISRAAELVQSGVTVICLLALSDDGHRGMMNKTPRFLQSLAFRHSPVRRTCSPISWPPPS